MRIALTIAVGWFLLPSFLAAADLERLPDDVSRMHGARFVELAAKLENPRISIDGDADKASGVHVPDRLGAIVIPERGLVEGEELAAKFKTELGAPLAQLFLYHLLPVNQGQRVDEGQLHHITFTDDQGTDHKIHLLLLAVRQLAEDDYRLYAYGPGKELLVDVRFSEGTGPGPEPVAIEIVDRDEASREGTMVVTVFGKYQASFRVGYAE